MRRIGKLTLVTVLGLTASVVTMLGQEPDLVLLNGKIFTSDSLHPYVEAIAIRGDRIVGAGTSRTIASLAHSHTKRIDLGGRTVIPGINDAHDHIGIAPSSYKLPIRGNDPSWSEVRNALDTAVGKAPKGAFITGEIGATIVDDPQATRAPLDNRAPDNPVLLWDWTGHAVLLNTAALRKLAIAENEPNPLGGRFARNSEDGKLNGWAFEYAADRISRKLTELTAEQEALSQMRGYFNGAVRLGITTVQNMPVFAPEMCLTLLQKLHPLIRVRIMRFLFTDQHRRITEEGRTLPSNPEPLVTISGTKLLLDGTPIERSAAMRQPYADRPNTFGELDFSEKEMEAILRESLQNDDQLLLHVVGDQTTEIFLNAMDATGGENVWSKRRVRIEHGDGIMPDLVDRVKKMGVIVVPNPTHFGLRDLFLKRFGRERTEKMQPLRSLFDAGIPVALGSDGPNQKKIAGKFRRAGPLRITSIVAWIPSVLGSLVQIWQKLA